MKLVTASSLAALLAGTPAMGQALEGGVYTVSFGAETWLGDDPQSHSRVTARDDGKVVEFRAVGPRPTAIAYRIDRDWDGSFDREFGSRGGKPCVSGHVAEDAPPSCGSLATRGQFSESVVGTTWTQVWRIPRGELSRDGKEFGIVVVFGKGDEGGVPRQRGFVLASKPPPEPIAPPTPPVTAGRGEEVMIGEDPGNGTQAFLREDGDFLELRTLGPRRMYVTFQVDVNANGIVDPRIDVAYGLFGEKDGKLAPCATYRYGVDAESGCGEFPTRGTLSTSDFTGMRTVRWRIPRSELSADGHRFGYSLIFWDEEAKVVGESAPGTYLFAPH